jgi:hypothetical protein
VGDSFLAKNFPEQFSTDLVLVRIRHEQALPTAEHILMLASGDRPFEFELPKVRNERAPVNRAERRHYATS